MLGAFSLGPPCGCGGPQQVSVQRGRFPIRSTRPEDLRCGQPQDRSKILQAPGPYDSLRKHKHKDRVSLYVFEWEFVDGEHGHNVKLARRPKFWRQPQQRHELRGLSGAGSNYGALQLIS